MSGWRSAISCAIRASVRASRPAVHQDQAARAAPRAAPPTSPRSPPGGVGGVSRGWRAAGRGVREVREEPFGHLPGERHGGVFNPRPPARPDRRPNRPLVTESPRARRTAVEGDPGRLPGSRDDPEPGDSGPHRPSRTTRRGGRFARRPTSLGGPRARSRSAQLPALPILGSARPASRVPGPKSTSNARGSARERAAGAPRWHRRRIPPRASAHRRSRSVWPEKS